MFKYKNNPFYIYKYIRGFVVLTYKHVFLCQCSSIKVVLRLWRQHNADNMSEANAEIKTKNTNNERKRVTKEREREAPLSWYTPRMKAYR